jgi:hypothetical protein
VREQGRDKRVTAQETGEHNSTRSDLLSHGEARMAPYVRFGGWVVVLALGTVLVCIFQNVPIPGQQGVFMKRTEV